MRKAIIILLFIYTATSAQPGPGAASPAEAARIMPLGDSITELDWQGGYRGYLYKLLADGGFDFDFVGTKTTNHDDDNLGFTFPPEYWDHEGYNSATITGQAGSAWIWNQNVEAKLAANPPGIVLVLLGTNDLNNGCCSGAVVSGQMSSFLDQIWAVDSNIAVILGSTPSVDPARYAALNGRISDYVSTLPALVAAKEALGRRVALADHHDVMNTGADLVGDGIHPSPTGYQKMAQVWYDALTSAVSLPVGIVNGADRSPGEFGLLSNYPNPFNPQTTLRFALPSHSRVSVRIFNLLGEEVAVIAEGEEGPGVREVRWDAGDRPGGVYFCRMIAGDRTFTRAMLLIR